MRDDLLPTTASTLALLRRAMRFHRATATREGVGRGPREETAAGGTSARADPEGGRSLTERHLKILGVGAPPDRTEAGSPDFRW